MDSLDEKHCFIVSIKTFLNATILKSSIYVDAPFLSVFYESSL